MRHDRRFPPRPRYSKSRAALDLVREAGVELAVREYLQEPLTVEELRNLVALLGVRPIVVRNGRAVVGRPPELIRELL